MERSQMAWRWLTRCQWNVWHRRWVLHGIVWCVHTRCCVQVSIWLSGVAAACVLFAAFSRRVDKSSPKIGCGTTCQHGHAKLIYIYTYSIHWNIVIQYMSHDHSLTIDWSMCVCARLWTYLSCIKGSIYLFVYLSVCHLLLYLSVNMRYDAWTLHPDDANEGDEQVPSVLWTIAVGHLAARSSEQIGRSPWS